jgi:hypothetical protein
MNRQFSLLPKIILVYHFTGIIEYIHIFLEKIVIFLNIDFESRIISKFGILS